MQVRTRAVITRPRAQAKELAQQLEAAGCAVEIFPLLDIKPLEDTTALKQALGRLRSYRLVAFVSPNAIDAAFAHLDIWPQEVPIAVVGEGSRAALARHGVNASNAKIISPSDRERTDSQTLLAELALESLVGGTVLILRGETGRELLADTLKSANVVVEQVAAYRREAPVSNNEVRARLLLLLDSGCDWVITSSEALRNLVSLARDAGGEPSVVKTQQQTLIVPHVRIAETARALGFCHVIQTGSGHEALIAALQSRP